MSKTVYINGRFLTQPVTGVQRYALELTRQMDCLVAEAPTLRDLRFVCLAPPEKFTSPSWKNIELRRVGWNTGNLWEQIDLPFQAGGQILFSPANIGPWYYRNQVVTLHDASVFAMPGVYSRAFRLKYRFVFQQLAQHARLILTDSSFSQRELAHYLHSVPQRFEVVPLGCDHLDRVQHDERILAAHGLRKGCYFFTVASRSAHKNLQSIFEAFKQVDSDLKLVVAGGSYKTIFQTPTHESLPENVELLDYISDEELKALYENARAFIFPSFYEGFGLPVLEAMRCGCPVLCSNAASLPEVAGNSALYFDPHQVDQIAATCNNFLADPACEQRLRFEGRQHAEAFSWAAAAQRTLDILCRLATN